MKTNLMKDIFRLAFTKKEFSAKFIYLFKGFIFFPILVSDKFGKQDKADASLAGDDVYPLF